MHHLFKNVLFRKLELVPVAGLTQYADLSTVKTGGSDTYTVGVTGQVS